MFVTIKVLIAVGAGKNWFCDTVDREIFVVKIFSSACRATKIKHEKLKRVYVQDSNYFSAVFILS